MKLGKTVKNHLKKIYWFPWWVSNYPEIVLLKLKTHVHFCVHKLLLIIKNYINKSKNIR
jgi:hypothetical protein